MSLTCGDLIKRGVALYGRQTALVFEDKLFSFAEQASRRYRLANALLARGLHKQERVAVLARNCNEYIECFGAGEVAGFITINLNSRLAQPELAEICQDCAPAALIYAAEFAAEARAIAAQVSSIRIRVTIGAVRGRIGNFEQLIAEASADEPPVKPSAGDTAYMMYTSGTRRLKGVMISHAAMAEATRMLSSREPGFCRPTRR